MREIGKRGNQKHRVLVTVESKSDSALTAVAAKLGACGLDDIQLFHLGGVISGEARSADLASMRKVAGVASIETDNPFSAI